MDFAQEIADLRSKHNLTQAEFAQSIGVCTASIRSWESGQYNPAARHLRTIDATYNTDLISYLPEKSKRKPVQTKHQNYIPVPDFGDDVEVFKTIITLLKLFMLLNPLGRAKVIQKITIYANDEKYQIPRMRAKMQEKLSQES